MDTVNVLGQYDAFMNRINKRNGKTRKQQERRRPTVEWLYELYSIRNVYLAEYYVKVLNEADRL